MKNKSLLSLTTIALFLVSSISFSQTLEFGTLESFEAFTGTGNVTNGGTATGDAGTNNGTISGSGFNPANGYTGTTHTSSPLTVQARIDLLRVYIHLDDVFVTHPNTHTPSFGSGETISPGVYSISGAGSLDGAITLNGGGDANAVFIIKFEGAFTVGAGSEIILAGGTRAANVFWISQGATSVAASCVMKGTLFSQPGAVTLGAGSTLEGRMLTSSGTITIADGGATDMPAGRSTVPIKCIGGDNPAPAVDVLGSIKSFAMFTSDGAVANSSSSGIVGAIGTNKGAISGFLTSTHTNSDATTGTFYNSDNVTAQAVIDLDNAYATLMAFSNTVTTHTPAFGSGERIFPGVYSIAGAGSLAGAITLDGNDDPDAIFILKFGGAFTVAARSKVILVNGARSCNVFWISGAGVTTGALNLGSFSCMKGNLFAHGGVCSAGEYSSIEGRMLSTSGAIGFSAGVVYNEKLCFADPVIAVVKSAVVNGTGILGDEITYTFTVENTGNTILTNVVVTDPMAGLTITGGPISSLERGGSSDAITGTYTITQEDINTGSITNSALVTAKGPEGNDITDISGTTNENDIPTVIPIVSVVDNCDGTSTLSTNATGNLLWSTTETTSTIIVNSAGEYTVTATVDGNTSSTGKGTSAPKESPDDQTVNVQTEEDNYLWELDGTKYTVSGTYTHIRTNEEGCEYNTYLQLEIEKVKF